MASAHEQLILDILANTTQAERSFGSLSRSVSASSDDVMGLAKRLDDLDKKSVAARVALQGNTEALAQLDKLDLKMRLISDRVMSPKVSIDGAARAAVEIAALNASFDKLGKSAQQAAGAGGASGLAALTGTGAAGGGGIGALIAAGVALSPVLITVATGLAGFGAAALGVSQNTKLMGQILKPLKSDFAAFTKELQPTVLGVFNQGIKLAAMLMGDIEPVAKATGKAFGTFLGQFGATLQNPAWTRFWAFMAATAPQDMRLLGNVLLNLTKDLPSLVMALQPVATTLLTVANDAVLAANAIGKHATEWGFFAKAGDQIKAHASEWGIFPTIARGINDAGNAINTAGDAVGNWARSLLGLQSPAAMAVKSSGALTLATSNANDAFGRTGVRAIGLYTVNLGRGSAVIADTAAGQHYLAQKSLDAADAQKTAAGAALQLMLRTQGALGPARDLSNNAVASAKNQDLAARAAEKAGTDTQHYGEAAKLAALSTWTLHGAVTALTTAMQKNDAGLLTLQGDVITWKQSLQAATTQLNSNKAGLEGNSAKALANKAAVLASSQAAQTLAEKQLTMRDGLEKASGTIAAQITWLQKHGDKSAFAAREIEAFRDEEALIKAQIRSAVTVAGSGTWRVTAGTPAGQPGKTNKAGFAAGTTGAPPGWAWVGERGPELAYFRGGETVLPTHVAMAVAAPPQRGYAVGVMGSFSGSIPGLTKWIGSEMGSTIHAIQAATAAAVLAGMRQATSAASGAGVAGPGGGAPAANAALARRMMPSWGSGAEWNAWNAVAMAESGWNQFARNPSSGAYGIPQALPPGKMGAAANPPQSNPAAQISWMIGYIRSVYGDPIGAAAHENAFHWYGSGGSAWFDKPTIIGVGERGPERVDITPAGSRHGHDHKITVEFKTGAAATALERGIIGLVQQHVIVHGGDVQAALGQRA